MRILRILLVAALTLAVSVAAYANHYSDTYVIPIVGHTGGQNGSLWMSDLAITNFATTPLTVQLIVVESGESNFADNIFPLTTATNTGSVTVAANTSVLLRDILDGHRGRTNPIGALILGGDKPFAVTSRVYNGGTGGNAVGETVPAVRDFFENSTGRLDIPSVVYLPGIVSNGSTRTNIGFLAGTGSATGVPMTVAVTIKNAAGQTLGMKAVFIPAGNFVHTQFSVASITNTPFDVGSAEISITSGLGTVVPYAAVIDNASNNAAYIMGQFPPSTPLTPSSNTFSKSIFRGLIDAMSRRDSVNR